ncbi:MAG: NAD(+)/NADH kinase, partial [Clostridia bacterium]
INLGHIGFLTEVDYKTLEDTVLNILKGNYSIENRAMLCVQVENKQHFAINEVLLSNSNNCHISVFEAYVDGVLIDKIRSDGMMVSTATGSTAYSLSCNGPIMSPMVKAFIINTICPHSLHSCPMVVSDESEIVINTANKDMRMIIDGKIVANFDDGISITVKKSSYFAKFIRLTGESFYQKLLKKLSYWGD